MELLWRIVPWLGMLTGLILAAWGGGTLRWALFQGDAARERVGWMYFLVGWAVLVLAAAALISSS